MSKPKPKQPIKPKAGRSASAVAAREDAFIEAYLSNGQNMTEAGIAAGFTGKRVGINESVRKLMNRPHVRQRLTERARSVAELAGMSTEAWAHGLRAIAFSDIGAMLGSDGKLAPVATLPPHVRASIASVKEMPDGTVVADKLWNKNDALTTMARHLGLFERDNAQAKSDVRVVIVPMG